MTPPDAPPALTVRARTGRVPGAIATSLATVLLLSGCVSSGDGDDQNTESASGAASSASTGFEMPPTAGRLDYQLGGASFSADGTPQQFDVVARDSTDVPLEGAYSICYVNGFQTQPGQEDLWATTDAVLTDASGNAVVDPDWPDELVLDPSDASQRDSILAVMDPIIRGCADDGFAGVEIDNLDTFTRFDGVSEAGALDLARSYVEIAHDAGLAIGQKNAAELADRGRDEIGFDFAVTEECAVFAECGSYRDAYGDHVLQIEYTDAGTQPFEQVCADPDRAPLTILRDRNLTPAGHPDHSYEQCGPRS
ncbi:MAG: endo alpha-1,4 polygalactosaminidase [Mycetocola sp.]